MRGVNHVVLMGYVGNKPKGKQFPDGGETTSFRLSTKDVWTDPMTGQKVEETEWHNITGFNNFARLANTRLNKGALILVHGSLKTRSWDNNDGSKSYKTEVVIEFLEMLKHGQEDYVDNAEQSKNYQRSYSNNNQHQQYQNSQAPYNNGNQGRSFQNNQSSQNNGSQRRPYQNNQSSQHNGSQRRPYQNNQSSQHNESQRRTNQNSQSTYQNGNQRRPYQNNQTSQPNNRNYDKQGFNGNNQNWHNDPEEYFQEQSQPPRFQNKNR